MFSIFGKVVPKSKWWLHFLLNEGFSTAFAKEILISAVPLTEFCMPKFVEHRTSFLH